MFVYMYHVHIIFHVMSYFYRILIIFFISYSCHIIVLYPILLDIHLIIALNITKDITLRALVQHLSYYKKKHLNFW